MNDTWRFISRRVPLMLASLWLLITVIFLLVALTPVRSGAVGRGTVCDQRRCAAVARRLGLDKSLWTRYVDYWNELIHGSLGTSFFGPQKVMSQIGQYLPSTLELVILSLIVGGTLGISLGAISAYYHRRWPDRISSGTVSVLQALPDFLLGVVLIYLFAYIFKLLPGPEGQLSIHERAPSDGNPDDPRRQSDRRPDEHFLGTRSSTPFFPS